jgi:Chemotaxis phosphatase CheX
MTTFPPQQRLAELVTGVTETMLGISFKPAVFANIGSCRWRTAVLQISGAVPVTVGISSDEPGCAALGSAMFACDRATLDSGMMNDALCELVNMTAGVVKTAMDLDQTLGLPKILESEAATRRLIDLGWPPVALKADGLGLLLWLCAGTL